MWKYVGRERPPFADEPKADQESVWDYPRPPRLEAVEREVRVELAGHRVADASMAWRVCETASPPTYYLPLTAVTPDALVPAGGGSICEWKGIAAYFDVVVAGGTVSRAAWAYPQPSDTFAALSAAISFYPALLECYVDGERVRPQPGRFYGGWVTDELAGPFKGEPGSEGW